MPEVRQLIAGPERSIAITPQGTFAWGNIKTVVPLSAGEEAADLCKANAAMVGHNRYAQEVPQRMSPRGMHWDGVADTAGQLVAWSGGHLYQFGPELVWQQGARVQELETAGQLFDQVWGGTQAVYARNQEGRLFAWGDGSYGRLGLGDTHSSALPGVVAALQDVRHVAAGMGHVLALDGKGRVWTWGANAAGQLGHGDLQARFAPQHLPLPHKVIAVAAGATHSLALDARGRLWGWGSNQVGQLDSRWKKTFVSAPARITHAHRLTALGAGIHFSAAVTALGQVLTWGWNGLGQLGQGSEAAQAGMHAVRLPETIRSISVSNTHVLAMGADGSCWAWGDNRHGACQGEEGRHRVQNQPHRLALHAIDTELAEEQQA